ncbi:ATP-binding protein [Streptomyces massasporeus]|uniref:ATP-binding protein n=1 Tax=Streptomyces massasporeus TaxID=67324 RepID=UPI0036FB7DC0
MAFLEVPPYFDRRAQDHVSAGMAGTPSLPTARIRDQREAEAWLITERANLIATVLDSLTQSDSTARLAVRLTELLQWYLYPYAAPGSCGPWARRPCVPPGVWATGRARPGRCTTKILEGDVLRDNPQYREPEDFVGDLDRLPLASPPQPAATMRILPSELHAVRAFVADQAKRCGLSADALHNLLVAVTEVATNAIRPGDAAHLARRRPDLRDHRLRQLAARGVHQLAAARVRGGLRLRTLGGSGCSATPCRCGRDRTGRRYGCGAPERRERRGERVS